MKDEVRERAEKWFDQNYYTVDPIARSTAIAAYAAGERAGIERAANLENALRGMLELERLTHRLPGTLNAEWVAGIVCDAKEALGEL